MHRTLRLTVSLLKNDGLFVRKKLGKTGSILRVIVVFAFLPMAVQWAAVAYAMTRILTEHRLDGLVIRSGLVLSFVLLVVFGLFYSFGGFYLRRDIEILLSYPIRAWELLTARFVTTLFFLYLINGVVLIPIFIGYGLGASVSYTYIFIALIVSVLMPIGSASIAAIFVMCVIRWLPWAKNKDRSKKVAGLLVLLTAVLFSMAIFSFADAPLQPNHVINTVLQYRQQLYSVSAFLPGIEYAQRALTAQTSLNAWGYVGLLTIVVGILYSLFITIGSMVYPQSVSGIFDVSAKKQSIKGARLTRLMGRKRYISSVLLTEWRTLVRTPAYFLNCVMASFVFPIMMLVPVGLRGLENGAMRHVLSSIDDGSAMSITLFFAMQLFMSASNAIASTAISREGGQFPFLFSLPMPIEGQIRYKLVIAVFISTVANLSVPGILLMLGLSSNLIATTAILALQAALFTSQTGLLVDMHHPKLDVDNEHTAVKQNFNVLVNMGIALIAGVLSFIIVIPFFISMMSGFIALMMVYTIMNILLHRKIKIDAGKIQNKLEVSIHVG